MNPEDIGSERDKRFYERDLIGSAVENALWRILTDSRYIVIHFFKEQVDELQQLIRTWYGNQSVLRVSAAPDLYVTIADPNLGKDERKQLARNETHFVEVTSQNTMSAESVTLPKKKTERLARQLDYWRDTLLVIFIQKDPFWYAQQLDKLEEKIREAAKNGRPVTFNLSTEFVCLTDVFTKIDREKLSGYTKPLRPIVERLRLHE